MVSYRIIPAYAGQISCRNKSYSRKRDHPRIRGTNFCFLLLPKRLTGSSPHTRDKYQSVFSTYRCRRIIPAYAGQILVVYVHIHKQQDHPRIRGTNYYQN